MSKLSIETLQKIAESVNAKDTPISLSDLDIQAFFTMLTVQMTSSKISKRQYEDIIKNIVFNHHGLFCDDTKSNLIGVGMSLHGCIYGDKANQQLSDAIFNTISSGIEAEVTKASTKRVESKYNA